MSVLPVPTEAEEGKALVAYLRVRGYKFTHIANESGSSRRDAMIRGARMKAQGVSRGFPDYLICVGNGLVAIELKRQKGGSTSAEQKDWLYSLNKAGVRAVVCKGASEAIDFIEQQAGF
jgi:hypothetical protein